MRGGRKGGQQRVSEERSRVDKVSKNPRNFSNAFVYYSEFVESNFLKYNLLSNICELIKVR